MSASEIRDMFDDLIMPPASEEKLHDLYQVVDRIIDWIEEREEAE